MYYNLLIFNYIKYIHKYKGTVELICISKTDFTDIIKNNLQLKWNANAIAIKKFSYFKHLSLLELNRCSTVSFIKIFKGNEYVLGE